MSDLPTGTVTFVFTDIEGSTSMLQRLGDAFVKVLEDHHHVMREAFESGNEIRSEGDAFFYVFPSAPDALRAACTAQRELAGFAWPEGATVMVRMGIHTGEGVAGGDDYVGLDVHRAARIADAGHGGQILISDATQILSVSALSDEVTLVDLGEHRLKDLEQPEHVYQAVIRGLPADFPPIKSLDAAPNNLPRQATAFIGRDREFDELQALLETNRLVTLTGPGGSGKTRLALHVASKVQTEFPDGVFYIPLESLRNADLVVAAIADQLGVVDGKTDSVLDAVVEVLGASSVLLLVDNFEHVVDAASLLAALLAGAPGLKALVTSQSPLRIRGEQIYPVPPMASAEAIDLFSGLAAASDPSFELGDDNRDIVEEVVTRLDGMPLALELTAPRVRLFGLAGLRDRLIERLDVAEAGFADLPERHRSLHDSITWSYDLLDDGEQSLLRQLSVFDGGFTLDAGEAVVSAAGGVAEGVASLLDRGLLRQQVNRGEARFFMLEAIRQFAFDALVEAGEYDDAARGHAGYFVELAETARLLLEGEDQQVWMDRLADEHDNIRAVLRFSRDTGQPDLGLRTAGSVWRFFHRRGHLPEARGWLELLLDLPGASPRARAEGLNGLAAIIYWQGDYEEAMRLYTELLDLFRTLEDGLRVADTLFGLSTTAGWLGDHERGRTLADEARAEYEKAGSSDGVGRVLGAVAFSTWQSVRLEEAFDLWNEARAHYVAIGDRAEILQTDVAIAAVNHQLGRHAEAVGGVLQALDGMVSLEDVSGTIMALDFVAAITADDDPEGAVRLSAAAHQLRSKAGGGLTAEAVGLEPARSIAAKAMDDASLEAAWAEGLELSMEDAVALGREVAVSPG